MDNNTDAKILEFPKTSLAKKSAPVVVAVGLISGGILTWVNYRAKKNEVEPENAGPIEYNPSTKTFE